MQVREASYRVRDVDGVTADRLALDLGVHPVTARCLASRGITDAAGARSYLEPRLGELRPPAGLAGLAQAIPRLVRAIQGGERIGVFGDYDVDGVTTAALMTSYLRELGCAVSVRVARRAAGYGYGTGDLDYFSERGCSLVVTGDCGTSDLHTLRASVALGIDTIVVDHHTVPERAAEHPAVALVNPFRADSTFPFQGMASVGLAFYVMAQLRSTLRAAGHFAARPEPDLRSLLDLVALGTIADLVPLTWENRILTADGLRRLAGRTRPGLAALLDSAGVGKSDLIDARTVSWKLGPRLNAPGRLGDSAPALDLLLAPDRIRAEEAAAVLERCNQERRDEQDRVMAEVEEQLGSGDPGPAVVVAGRGWQSGVAGIVAAKLVDRYRRPAFVIALDPVTGEGRGSGRSAGGVDLYRALTACEGQLVRYGGHAAAAGLTVGADRVDALRESLGSAVAAQEGTVDHALAADAEVELDALDERLVTELGELAPFGKDNEEPVLLSRGVSIADSRRVGDGSHLKLTLSAGGRKIPAIAFGWGERDPGRGAVIDAAYVPSISTWNGRRRLELNVRALFPRPKA